MRTVTITFLFILSLIAESQQKLIPAELREDFEIFQGSLEDFHPGLYWYNSVGETNQFFEEAYSYLDKPLTSKEFLRILAPVISKVGCSHTNVRPFFDEKRKLFPFKLSFIDQEAFYIKNYGVDSINISPGSKIISINGSSIDSLIQNSLNYLSTDGDRLSGKYFLLNNYLQYVYADYFESSDYFIVEYQNKNKKIDTIRVKALTYQEIVEIARKKTKKESDPRNLILTYQDSIYTAILKVKRFANWRENGKTLRYEKKLRSIFQSIEDANTDQLIIDLRGNGGGKMPWELYSYLTDSSFTFAKKADFILSKDSYYFQYQKLHPYMRFLKRKWLHTWIPSSKKMKMEAENWVLTNHEMLKTQSSSNPTFKGKIYVLIDGGTSSAASLFAAKMKSDTDAIFIGKETGGGYYGNTAVEKTYVQLPNSKLELAIPLVRFHMNVKEVLPHGSGVVPDYTIVPTIEDLIQGVDVEMNFAMQLIKENRVGE